MYKKNLAAAALCLAVFAGSFALAGGVAVIWNLVAFLVVVSGSLAALLLSYPLARIRHALSVARNAYLGHLESPAELVHTLLDLTVKSRINGVLCLEKAGEQCGNPFLKNALNFLVDNYREREIRDILTAEMTFFSLRRSQHERIFLTMARIAPALGVAGSVIGLAGLLTGVGDTGTILKHIPVAFVSTLYGIVASNLIFAPMAECVHFRTRAELLNHKLIMEGVIAMRKEQNPYKLEKKLTAFLSPQDREGKAEVLRTLTRRYLKMRQDPLAETSLGETPPPAAAPLKEVRLAKAS